MLSSDPTGRTAFVQSGGLAAVLAMAESSSVLKEASEAIAGGRSACWPAQPAAFLLACAEPAEAASCAQGTHTPPSRSFLACCAGVYPEEVVQYYSPGYSQQLLNKLEALNSTAVV